jgi:pilus assembly protein Flp/PilA
MNKNLIGFFKDEEGIETIEYALIAALVAIAVVVGATFLGEEVNDLYSGVGSSLSGTMSS